MRHAADRTVVAGGQDRAIPHDHGTDVLALTGGAGRGLLGDAHEVLVPVGSHDGIVLAEAASADFNIV